jgi:demethylmenaquinone methyltransferase/2-methoxy-6-polyprenyl-1,4-benzoquinol methylase
MGILEDKENARLFYKYLSKVYDRINPFIWNAEMRDEALKELDIDPTDRVLDVGCGTGFATEGLLRYSQDIHGLDQSIHQMEKAFSKFGRTDDVKFYRGDAERLPFADNSFDVIFCEFRRVVKPGNRVLVVGPDYPDSWIFQQLADAIMLFYDETEAQEMFETAGFVDIEHHVQQAYPGTPQAITTIARAPTADDTVDTPSQQQVSDPAAAPTTD